MDKVCPVCGNAVSDGDSACNSCGFKLHGSTQEFAPVSLDGEAVRKDAKADDDRTASLTVLKGPQVGIRINLTTDGKPLTVGRSPRCEVFLNDMTVSRHHALIELTPAGYRITDQNSFNGIWINNKNITSTILKDGDIIQIGAFCLLVEC